MTKQEWLNQALQNEHRLVQLVQQWHPCSRPTTRKPSLAITAGRAEQACANVRQSIQADKSNELPVERLRAALNGGDIDAILSILNDAWFGVPESTSCWDIPGFREAVRLIEDPPEQE